MPHNCNSKIFKTFNSDIDKSISKIGMFNKSFWAMQQDLKHGNGIGFSIFSGQGITSKDKQSILDFNTVLKSGVSPGRAWATTMSNCSIAAQDQARQCLRTKGNLTELANELKVTTVSAKAAEVGLKALSIAGNMLLMWGISELISGIYKLATYSSTLAEKASEVGSAFKESETDIATYKSKIEELQRTVNDSSSSYDDVKQARVELMKIQDELIDKYGTEEGAVKNITDAVKGQIDALDELTNKEYQKMVNDFNKTDFWGTIENSFKGSNFQQMLDDMEHGKYKATFTISGDNDFNKLLKNEFGAQLTGAHGEMSITGNLQDVYDKLLTIQELSKQYDTGNFFDSLSSSITKAEDKLEDYQDIWKAYVLHDKILNPEKANNFDDYYKKANDTYEKYQKSVEKNGFDSDITQQWAQEYTSIINQAMDKADSLGESGISDYFRKMNQDLVNEINSENFQLDFKANTNGIKEDISNAVKEFNTSDNILNYNSKTATDGQKTAYETLTLYAHDYHMEVEDLVALLEQLGLVTSQTKKDLLNKLIPSRNNSSAGIGATLTNSIAGVDSKVATGWVNSLTEEEAKLANSKEFEQALEEQKEKLNGATLSAENYETALQNVKAAQEQGQSNESDILSISDTIDKLNTQLKPTMDALKEAYQGIFTDDGFTLGDVDISTFTSIKSAIDELNGIDGIEVNYDDFDNFVKVLSDTSSTSEQVQEQFDKLATSIVYSTDCTEMSTDTFDLLCKSLYEMGLTNVPEVLSNIKTAQEELKTSGINLKTVTSEEAKAFINEAQASDIAKEYLRLYMIQKELANNNPLDTSASIQHLKELCTQLGMTYNSLGKTSEMMQAILSLESATNAIAAGVDPGGHYTAQAEAARKKIEELKNSGFEDYSYNFNSNNTVPSTNPSSGNSSASSSATSTTPSEVTKEFNWIETYLEAFAKKTEKIMNKVSDYLSFKKNISTIKSAVKAVQKEISANEKTLQNYQEQMNAVGLDSKYIDKIKNGDLTIETITGYETNGSKDANAQLIEKIEKYQELYSTYTSIEDTLEDLRNTEKEWLVKNLEYINEYYQKLSDLKNLAIDKKQDNIDLKEAQGRKVTTGDYNGLISNNESYIKSLRTTYKKTNAEFNNLVKNGTIEKDSSEWFEWTEILADISSEIVQAQINTEEWKDEIEDLNIQKYADVVDKLKTKNDELNDVISEREALGLEVREKDYSSLIKNNDSQIKQLEKQNALLAEYQSQVQKGSDRWKEFQDQIDSNNSSIRQLNQSTTELINNIANIPIEKRDDDLETSSDRLALLQKKYDNATSSKERKEILKLMEEEQKKQREINEQAKITTKNNLAKSQNNLLNYKSEQQSKAEKSSADIKENEKYISSKQKEFNTLSKQESSLNKKISAIDQKIKNTKDKTLLKELNNQKKDYEKQLDEIQSQKNQVSSQLTTANKNLEKSKAELKEAEKNVSTLSGFKEGEKIDTEGITDQETLKWVKEYNLALDACEKAEYDAAVAEEEWTAQMRENAQTRLDIIKEEYESLIDLNNSYSDATNSFINMRKVQGNPIEDSLYEDLIRNSQKNVDLAYAEWQKHSEQMAQNDYSNDPEGYQKALAENNRLQQAWYESVKTAEEYLDTLMDSRIEALEEEKDKLQKLHELQERRYKLEEAKYNLEKAKQRTNLVYNGTEFVYQADAKSVKDAEKALEDAEYDELINKIDDWIDAIEAAKKDINLYDADGNPLTNTDEIIEAAKAFGDSLLDGLSKLLENNGYTSSDVSNVPDIVAVKDEELIFTKEQGHQLQQKFSGVSPTFTDSVHLKPRIPTSVDVNTSSHIEINMNGNMQFNEVKNVNDLSKAIVNGQLRSSMKRELGKRKM